MTPWAYSGTLRDLGANSCCHYLAKATDENLTSENWEYILVRWSEPTATHRIAFDGP